MPGAGCGLWALKLNPAPDAICCFLTVNNFEPDENDPKGAKAKWDAADEFMRFYLMPGRAHGGGSGVVELKGRNEALIDWVESGIAPGALNGILKTGGTHSVAPLKVR